MLTIGEFSRLSRVTPRMLRHYDALGLLCPQTVGENGYRYYRQEQLSDLVRLQWLKSYGFSLGEIGPLLALEGAQLLPHLLERRNALEAELEERRETLLRMEADILRMEGKKTMENQYHVILMEDPEQRVFSIRRTVGVDQYHALFQELRHEAEKRGLKQAGPIQMLYHDPDFNHDSSDVEAQMVVSQDGMFSGHRRNSGGRDSGRRGDRRSADGHSGSHLPDNSAALASGERTAGMEAFCRTGASVGRRFGKVSSGRNAAKARKSHGEALLPDYEGGVPLCHRDCGTDPQRERGIL